MIASRSCLPLAAQSNTLKAQFLQDMELAGLAATSRRTYLDAVEQLVRYYWCGPHELTEQQVSDYLLERHRHNLLQGPAVCLAILLRPDPGQRLASVQKMRSLSQFRLPKVLEHADCLRLIHTIPPFRPQVQLWCVLGKTSPGLLSKCSVGVGTSQLVLAWQCSLCVDAFALGHRPA